MIDIYVNDIKKSLENNCYYSALALALMLPDICGMAEFPNETSVGKRYIEWYDKYLGTFMAQKKDMPGEENTWMSGEIVYNLRNTYLHTGSPNVMADKVKEEANQIDRFILVLGDGTVIWDSTIAIDLGLGEVTFKGIMVDVSYLCHNICGCALWFYENNREKFQFNFNAIAQEDVLKQLTDNESKRDISDIYVEILNEKLFDTGSTMRVCKNPSHNKSETKQNTEKKKAQKNVSSKQKISKEKREAQVRSFFGRYFKEAIYLEKKEVIIQAVLKSKTKQQVNNRLMKSFSSKETGIIYKRLGSIIKDLPGK